MNHWIRSLFKAVQNVAAEVSSGNCAFCGRSLYGKRPSFDAELLRSRVEDLYRLCSDCLNDLEFISGPCCQYCGRPMKGEERKQACQDCRKSGAPPFVWNRSCVRYRGRMKEWVALYKYRGRQALYQVFGEMIAETGRMHISSPRVDAVTYVPLHKEREMERGFNQSERMARVVARRWGVPLYPLLSRMVATPKQSKMTKRERTRALTNRFSFCTTVWKRIQKEHPRRYRRLRDGRSAVVLIDDIYTTGTTVTECSRILQEQGVRAVYVLTLCR